MAKARQNLNIELAHGNKERLEKLRDWNGMTQKELVSRILTWFCAQDRVVQQIILGQIPSSIAPDVAQLLLKQLAESEHPSTNTNDQPDLIVEIPPDPAKS